MGNQHQLLALARQARGLSQTQLALEMHSSQAKVSDLESGIAPLEGKYLSAAADALKLPLSYFEQDPPQHATDTAPFHHRKLQSVGAGKLGQTHARMRMVQLQVGELLQHSPERFQPQGFRPMEPEEHRGGATEIASLLRLMWNIPSGPISNLVDLAETNGALVIPWDFNGVKIDGVSRYVPGMPPMIFLNLYAPGDRCRRTLAHEIAHLIMHVGRMPDPTLEQQADAFASEFLLPAREIHRDLLMGVDLHRLVALKAKWGVSIQSLIMRAKDLDIITERQQRTMFVRLSERGWRTNEPGSITPETPRALCAEIDKLQASGRSIEEIAARVRCTAKEFLATFYPNRRELRLVQ